MRRGKGKKGAKDKEVNGQGGKGGQAGAPAPSGVAQSSTTCYK